jgi:hypothetical protein
MIRLARLMVLAVVEVVCGWHDLAMEESIEVLILE